MISSSRSDLWIRRYRPAPDAPVQLVCFPHAGGSASYYLPVAQTLGSECDVLAVQYPGRQDRYREPLLDSISELVTAIRGELAYWLDRPYALFGHSMGAVVAFEVARLLEDSGMHGPDHLFVSGRRAPSCQRAENVHLRSDADIAHHVKHLQGTDSSLLESDELLRLLLPVIRADYRAIETYPGSAGGEVHCPVTVFSGDCDPLTSRVEAESWQKHTTEEAETLFYPGGHFFLNEHAMNVTTEIGKRISI